MFLFKHTRTRAARGAHVRTVRAPLLCLLPASPPPSWSFFKRTYTRTSAYCRTHTEIPGEHSSRTSLLRHVLRDPRVISRRKAAAAAAGALRMKPNRGTPSTILPSRCPPFALSLSTALFLLFSRLYKRNSVSRVWEEARR